MQSQLDVRALDPTQVTATCGRTVIQIWRGTPSGRISANFNRIALEFASASVIPATMLFVVEASSPAPDEETRKNFAAMSRDVVAKMAMAVIVSEGGGFRGALVRAVGVALTTIMPHRSPLKFVNDVESAAQLLKPHLVLSTGGVPGLLKATAELRTLIPAK